MKPRIQRTRRRATILLMIVGLLAMLFVIVSAYIVLARFDRQTLGYVRQSDQITQIIESVHNLIVGELRGSGGGDALRGANYAETFGYQTAGGKVVGAPWLASPEPVRNPGLSPSESWLPRGYRYPAVSGLGGTVVGVRTIEGLMFHASADQGQSQINVDPGSPLAPDTLVNAREPFMDADGDGISDSFFGGAAVLNELANAMAGTAVSGRYPDGSGTSPIDPSVRYYDVGNPNDPRRPNRWAWDHFNELARYLVAARVVSHGGMVQVSAPSNAVLWNSQFLAGMFNWVRHPNDSGGQPTGSELLAMWTERFTVEPVLRRRGGLLAGYDADAQTGVPPALWNLQQRFRNTFKPYYPTSYKADDWQRFNLADIREWTAWRLAASLDARDYNAWYNGGQGMGGPDPRPYYAPRQLLTTVNNSDELAREHSVNASKAYWDFSVPANVDAPGIEVGDLKFYLGRIRAAFAQDRHFKPAEGQEIVRELINYYSEMLAAYAGWEGEQNASEAVSRHEQACMLAVNTVAFAAPRSLVTPGFVDNVWFWDRRGNKMYVGYAPQPFITQVMAYKDREGDIALAIELYNPNERSRLGGADEHALYLPQFAISLNDAFPADPNELRILGNNVANLAALTGLRMPGRSFLTIIINDAASNSYFETNMVNGNQLPLISDLAVSASPSSGRITVRLWRIGQSGPPPLGCALVDQFEIEEPDDPTQQPPPPEWQGSYVDAWRDTNSEAYWGVYPTGEEARWRCVVAFPPEKPTGGSEPGYQSYVVDDGVPHNDPNNPAAPNRLITLNGPPPWNLPAGPGLGVPSAPATPLPLMNADPGWLRIHGAARPSSFPTVGFLFFVPRFAHMGDHDGTNWVRMPVPMTTTLYMQWTVRGLDATTIPPTYPADFGHMPIFDNKQEVRGRVGGFDDTGRIPWGLLVFDYFTTLNPRDANGDGVEGDLLDPYRVAGRININVAPWYVLAGLPLLGPEASNNAASGLPLRLDQFGNPTNASPAFWSSESGIMAGRGADGTYRYLPWLLINRWGAQNGQWYRLGPYYAQAVAGYRDRTGYTNYDPQDAPFAEAFRRESAIYRPAHYGQIRGQGEILGELAPTTAKRGFLTVGELANVMGFDGTADPLVGVVNTTLGRGDFMKAVSLLALLDTHFLTTRSNTFTIYASLTDRANPQASVRTQVTIDRSNLLPRLIERDTNGDGIPDQFTLVENTGVPETIGRREVSYFNARYDD